MSRSQLVSPEVSENFVAPERRKHGRPPVLLPEGTRYGRLTATCEYEMRELSVGKRRLFQKFICDCGNALFLVKYSVTSGNTSSCGCLHTEGVRGRMRTHGQSKTLEYRTALHGKRRAQKMSTKAEHLIADDLNQLLVQYDNKCWICEDTLTEVTWDHYQPLSKGGPHTKDNLRPSCRVCNSKKSNLWPFTEDMKKKIADEVRAKRVLTEDIPSSVKDGSEVTQDVLPRL